MSESCDTDDVDAPDIEGRLSTWDTIDDKETLDFVHIAFYETPGPKHCNFDPDTTKPIDLFDLFFTATLLIY